MSGTYDAGNTIKVYTSTPFTTAGSAVDPTTVNFVCQKPDGTFIRATYTAGSDPSGTIVKDAVGTYHANVVGSLGGTYQYRFYSTGSGAASSSGQFYVTTDALV